MISVHLELVLHLDFAASLKVKGDLKLIPSFNFLCANFELIAKLQFAELTETLSTQASGVAVSLASFVARINCLINVIFGVLVDAILSAGLEGVVVVVNPVLVNVTTEIAVVSLEVTLVGGVVLIVASILVDVSRHILFRALSIASNTTVASLLADVFAVLVAFAAVA